MISAVIDYRKVVPMSHITDKTANMIMSTYTRERPWKNVPQTEISVESSYREFYEVLTSGLEGASINREGANLILLMGFSSQGYSEENGRFALILEEVREWAEEMDRLHNNNWILVTHGDADYGHYSITTLADFISLGDEKRTRNTPVVCLQSDFYHSEPGSVYWPYYASAVLFGPGKHHSVHGTSPSKVSGGYVKTKNEEEMFVRRTGELGFPDEAMMTVPFNNGVLQQHLFSILSVGGGDITREQAEIYRLLSGARPHDKYISALSKHNEPSILNAVYVSTKRRVDWAKDFEDDRKLVRRATM